MYQKKKTSNFGFLRRRKKLFYNRTCSESHTGYKEKKRKYYSEDFIRAKHALYYNEHAAFIRKKKCSYYAKNCGFITEKRQNYRKENSERRNTIFKIVIRKGKNRAHISNEFRKKCYESYFQNPSDLKQKQNYL